MMQRKPKLFGDESERAVSPVIGVILMVAIVVILAATIATMMTDMTDFVGEPKPIVDAESSVNGDWDPGATSNELAYVSHINGDNVSVNDLRLVVRDGSGSVVGAVDGSDFDGSTSDVAVDAAGDDWFDVGSTLTVIVEDGVGLSSKDEFTVQLSDTSTGTTLHDSTHQAP